MHLKVRELTQIKQAGEYKMSKFTKEQVIEAGGKEWSKGALNRVYVKSEVVKKLIDFDKQCEDSYFEKNTKAIFQRIDSNQTWFNVKTGKFESKKVSVDAFFNTGIYSELFNE